MPDCQPHQNCNCSFIERDYFSRKQKQLFQFQFRIDRELLNFYNKTRFDMSGRAEFSLIELLRCDLIFLRIVIRTIYYSG